METFDLKKSYYNIYVESEDGNNTNHNKYIRSVFEYSYRKIKCKRIGYKGANKFV